MKVGAYQNILFLWFASKWSNRILVDINVIIFFIILRQVHQMVHVWKIGVSMTGKSQTMLMLEACNIFPHWFFIFAYLIKKFMLVIILLINNMWSKRCISTNLAWIRRGTWPHFITMLLHQILYSILFWLE